MTKKSRVNRSKESRERRQLRWECLRLNTQYRKAFDAYLETGERGALEILKCFANLNPPDYSEKDLMRALCATNSHIGIEEIEEELFENDLAKGEHIKVEMPLNFEGAISLVFCNMISKQEVLDKIEEIFERLEILKKKQKFSNRKPKISLLRDALEIYEKHKLKKITLRDIAKVRKTASETYSAAYNRVKKQLERAIHYIEDGECHFV